MCAATAYFSDLSDYDDDAASDVDDDHDNSNTITGTCPVCNLTFPFDIFIAHVNECLEQVEQMEKKATTNKTTTSITASTSSSTEHSNSSSSLILPVTLSANQPAPKPRRHVLPSTETQLHSSLYPSLTDSDGWQIHSDKQVIDIDEDEEKEKHSNGNAIELTQETKEEVIILSPPDVQVSSSNNTSNSSHVITSRIINSGHSHSSGVTTTTSTQQKRSLSMLQLQHLIPDSDAHLSFLDNYTSQLNEDDEEWLMHIDPFEKALTDAQQYFKAQQKHLSSSSKLFSSSTIAANGGLLSNSSIQPNSALKSPSDVLTMLANAHATSLQQLQQLITNQFSNRLSSLKSKIREYAEQARHEAEQRVATVESIIVQHDTYFQRQKDEELSRIRIEEWQRHDAELLAVEQQRRRMADEFSTERISVEQKLEQQLTQLRTEQRALQEKLLTHQLPEEVMALETGVMQRLRFYPRKNFTGQTAQEFHFRLVESQFLRMVQGMYKVDTVEYIIQPVLLEKYTAFVAEEKERRGGEGCAEYLTFHGTSEDAVEKIVVEGFKIGGTDVPMTTGRALGEGIYSSESPAFAMSYIKDGRTKLLFSRVCPSADSVINKDHTGVIQQLVVKRREQILPCYIVHFSHSSSSNASISNSAVFPALTSAVAAAANSFSSYGLSGPVFNNSVPAAPVRVRMPATRKRRRRNGSQQQAADTGG